MEEIFKIAGAIIVSIGGASVVLLGLSSWLGKVWANRILEKEKKEYQKEIEEYKAKLESELIKVSSLNDRAVHISKAQYDKEFEIYIELWEKLNIYTMSTLELYPRLDKMPIDKEEEKKMYQSRWQKYAESFNQFLENINKHRPFFEQSFFDKFEQIRVDCFSIGVIFETYKIESFDDEAFQMTADQRKDVYVNLPEKIKMNKENLAKSINTYLKSLRIV